MSATLWKSGSEEQLQTYVRAMDARFQCAMRQELRALAADRGLRIIPTQPAKGPRRSSKQKHRDVLTISSSASPSVALTNGQRIVQEVCEKHDITRGELLSARRAPLLVAARHEVMYRLSKETSLSFPSIGMHLGGRDHSTVIYGVKKHAAKLEAAAQ